MYSWRDFNRKIDKISVCSIGQPLPMPTLCLVSSYSLSMPLRIRGELFAFLNARSPP